MENYSVTVDLDSKIFLSLWDQFAAIQNQRNDIINRDKFNKFVCQYIEIKVIADSLSNKFDLLADKYKNISEFPAPYDVG